MLIEELKISKKVIKKMQRLPSFKHAKIIQAQAHTYQNFKAKER
jgi:hypothetical protein